MSESSPCIRCGRAIDAYAKTCVYCNWDQSATPPPASAQQFAQPLPAAVPDAKMWKRRAMFGAILVALAALAFAIGAFVHREQKRALPEAAEHGVTPPPTVVADNHGPRSDVTLIPVTDSAFLEAPVTSAPAVTATDGTTTNGAQRNDATALPSSEYAAVAERAKAEKQSNKALVDPRSITGAAYDVSGMPPRRPAAQHKDVPMSSSSAVHSAAKRTPPIPEYQPLPSIHVDRNMTARLRLTIGADGRVKGIAIGDAIPGQTPKLIAAVQNWRFRPATENGVPVEAPFAVDISFHGNE